MSRVAIIAVVLLLIAHLPAEAGRPPKDDMPSLAGTYSGNLAFVSVTLTISESGTVSGTAPYSNGIVGQLDRKNRIELQILDYCPPLGDCGTIAMRLDAKLDAAGDLVGRLTYDGLRTTFTLTRCEAPPPPDDPDALVGTWCGLLSAGFYFELEIDASGIVTGSGWNVYGEMLAVGTMTAVGVIELHLYYDGLLLYSPVLEVTVDDRGHLVGIATYDEGTVVPIDLEPCQ